MNHELIPCPICGSPARVDRHERRRTKAGEPLPETATVTFNIACTRPRCIVLHCESTDEAAACREWNIRWEGKYTEPPECTLKTCGYYSHYLCYYDEEKAGPQLTHEAYHHAEKHCVEAQKRVIEWYDVNADNNKEIPPYLERRAQYWEGRVCA